MKKNFSFLIFASILFRLSFLFSIPALSDDYFRFIWDGKMINMGVSPYSHIPSFFLLFSDHPDEYLVHLYAGMNSENYYSVYPPVMQFIFAMAAWIFPNNLLGSVMMIRVVCIAAEAGTLILLEKLLKYFEMSKTNLLWYALNPLVIIELSGNIHFEGVMIFFLLLSAWLLFASLRLSRLYREGTKGEKSSDSVTTCPDSLGKQSDRRNRYRLIVSAVSYGLSISTKFIPLLFLPFTTHRRKKNLYTRPSPFAPMLALTTPSWKKQKT